MRKRYDPEPDWLAVLNAVEAAPEGLTLRELADATGIPYGELGSLIRGTIARYPGRIERIAKARRGPRGRLLDLVVRVEDDPDVR